MGLGDLKKKDIRLDQDENKLNDFIKDSQVKTSKNIKKYARASYSLTPKLKEDIMKVSKSISVKCNESDVVKVAIYNLLKLDTKNIEILLEEYRNKNS